MKIKPAERLGLFNEYFFSERMRYINSLEEEGKEVINLGIGSPDLAPADPVKEALKVSVENDALHGYQPYHGTPAFREHIASFSKRFFDIDLNPENEILPLLGSKEGILHISLAFLNPGDKVLVPELGYPAYTSISRMIGAEVLYYPLSVDWEPDWQAIEKMDLKGVKLIWLNYPHMPTGAPGSKDLFKEAVAFGKSRGILICHDNPYSLVLNDNPLSIFCVKGSKDVCIELHSMSKSHNMAGWRVGWAAGNKEFIGNVLTIHSNIHSGMFRAIQDAAVEALNMNQTWHDDRNEIYLQRRAKAWELLDILNGSYQVNTSGMFVWGQLPPSGSDAETVSKELLENKNIFVTPGHIFGERGKRYIRISLCATVENFEKALKRMRE